MKMDKKPGKRILSGLQPSGKLHLGNYLGAIRQYLDLQENNDAYYFVANYHALTSINNARELKKNTYDVVLDLLALGLNPEKATIFLQSDIPEVCELSWILSTITPMSLLEKCHSYKDKIAKGIAPNHGLFAYPVLMAADILVYDSELVPVGKDQKQHIEITRDLALKFNSSKQQELFVVPEPYIIEELAVVPGIDGQKMSKSYNNTIELFAAEKKLRKRINRIVTDSTSVADPKDPKKCNVFALLKLFLAENDIQYWDKRYREGNMGYGEAKKALADTLIELLAPARKKRTELEKNPDYIIEITTRGAEKARNIASATLKRVRLALGLA